MPSVEELSDPQELRRCIRDIVALSALPATWCDHDPRQIAESITAALVSMLDADFVYARVRGKRGEPTLEVLRTGNRRQADVERIRTALLARLPDRPTDHIAEMTGLDPKETLRIASVPVGFGGDAVLVAGDSRGNFPTATQLLLLRIGSNEMGIAFHRWRAETDERRFATLVASSLEFIGIASLDGWPQYVNPAGLKLVGLESLEQACQAHIFEYLTEADRAVARDELWTTVIENGRWAGELNFRHFQSGDAIPFLVDWVRIDDPRTGKPMNMATVGRDLTAQKRSEAELRHLNATLEQRVLERTNELAESNCKLVTEILEREHADAALQELQLEFFHAARLSTAGQMAAALAHELNQPLTATTASVNTAKRLIARGNLQAPEGVAEALHDASDQVLRAGEMIHRLRDLVSRGETEQRLEDLSILLREASSLALAGSNGVALKVKFELDEAANFVFCNRVQIQQVLVNLVRNAVEAIGTSRPGKIVIGTQLIDAHTVEVILADNGPGLPDLVLDRLFAPFVSTKPDGMGLGLSICQSIVEAHGGRLITESNPGGGTIFRFTLAAAPQ
jgi:two-component system, LuxR family, sensor kinase FixL